MTRVHASGRIARTAADTAADEEQLALRQHSSAFGFPYVCSCRGVRWFNIQRLSVRVVPMTWPVACFLEHACCRFVAACRDSPWRNFRLLSFFFGSLLQCGNLFCGICAWMVVIFTSVELQWAGLTSSFISGFKRRKTWKHSL